MRAQGKTPVTAYWRTVREGGELNEKYPGGAAAQAEHLRAEGHEIEARGRKLKVKDIEKVLTKVES